MNTDFLYWSRMSKTHQLETLKTALESLERQLDGERKKHDRLMDYLGLVELTGPRIVKLGSLEDLNDDAS